MKGKELKKMVEKSTDLLTKDNKSDLQECGLMNRVQE